MKTAPCKDCQKRELGCHATCEAYLAYHAERVKIYTEQQTRDRINLPQSPKKIKQINSYLKNWRR